jgi:hypothetical protein
VVRVRAVAARGIRMMPTLPLGEPATPGGARMPLAEALERLAADGDRHMTTGSASEPELRACENALGVRLPEAFRRFLARLGSGIFYDRHEFFGPRSLQIHDIELVPSLPSLRARCCQGRAPGWLPFHRVGQRVHAFEPAGPQQPARIVALPDGTSYPDLESFLAAVVLEAH